MGFRSELKSQTSGQAVVNSLFSGYRSVAALDVGRPRGTAIACSIHPSRTCKDILSSKKEETCAVCSHTPLCQDTCIFSYIHWVVLTERVLSNAQAGRRRNSSAATKASWFQRLTAWLLPMPSRTLSPAGSCSSSQPTRCEGWPSLTPYSRHKGRAISERKLTCDWLSRCTRGW